MTYPYYPFNVRRIDNVRNILGIKTDEELEIDYLLLGEQKENIFLKEKPIYEDLFEIIVHAFSLDHNENLREQIINKKIPENRYKPLNRILNEYANILVKDENYEKAITTLEWLLENTKVDYETIYRLRFLYSKSLIISKDNNREDRINKLIKLERKLAKFENSLTGVDKKKESEIILNILEDCKENSDEDLVLRQLKFVEDYYSRASPFN